MYSLSRYCGESFPASGGLRSVQCFGQNGRHDRAGSRSGFDPEASVYGNQSLPDVVKPETAFDGRFPERPRVKTHSIVCDHHLEMFVFRVEQDWALCAWLCFHDIIQQLPDQIGRESFSHPDLVP